MSIFALRHRLLSRPRPPPPPKESSKQHPVAMVSRRVRSDIGQARRNKTFRWSDDMRVFLHVLHTDFTYSKAQNAIIFRSVFADDVQQYGATNERLQVIITAQVRERNQMRAKVWINICRTSLDAAELERRERFRALIQAAATSSKGHGTCRTELGPSSTVSALRPQIKASKATAARSSPVPETVLPPRNDETLQAKPPMPLSKQAPIGVWAPQSPPDEDEDELCSAAPQSKLLNTGFNARALVPVIARQQSVRTKLSLPATSSQRQRISVNVASAQKVHFTQTHGTVINITPKKLAQITKDLVPVSAQEAHPLMSGLVFRYWAEDGSSGLNSENGFTARKYANRVNFNQPPPLCTSLDWSDLFYHIDRIGIQKEFESPFISVSNSLIWIIRLALKEIDDKPGCKGRISVIDARGLARGSLYYVPPYHREMKKSFEFTAGSWRYAGTHEFIVWKEIPRRAIVHTFAVKDLMRFVRHSETLRRALRFDLISAASDLKNKIIPALRQRKVGLTDELTSAFARLANLMGFTTQSSIEHISNLLCELCQGWGINLVRQTDSEWNRLAGVFSNALFAADGKPRNLRDETCLKRGFLDGIAFASSAHFNTRHNEKTINLMYKQARLIGLGDPGKIIMDELAAAQFTLMMFEKKQQKTLPGYKTQLLLEGPANDEGFASADEEDYNDNDEVAVHQPMLRKHAARLMMEEDTMMQSDDEMVSYEFGDDGRVV
ncbi:hypothetical protein HII31_11323 [Pseudocercospora fuligena]|uniref:DUF7587 domain-containing protein n=1 Tax=Pseudocercospora fuligena TaxID=685502 RepID=A0A8H6R9A8_9PEZI|nr:hypothetical protein HII31_11323 [Pseudocercospora fuligena]